MNYSDVMKQAKADHTAMVDKKNAKDPSQKPKPIPVQVTTGSAYRNALMTIPDKITDYIRHQHKK